MSYHKLEKHFTTLAHLNHMNQLAGWDEQVMMPTGAGALRADAMATLEGLQHKHLTKPIVRDWLDAADQEQLNDHWKESNLHWMRKLYTQAICLPTELVEGNTKATISTEQAWRTMRADNNWRDFAPLLQQSFSLTLEIATIRGEALGLSPYDAMLDQFCCGETTSSIDPVFAHLSKQLPSLVQTIQQHQCSRTTKPITGHFNPSKQKQLALDAMALLGFDFDRGRLDVSHHPFCSGGPTDTRITTRYNNDDFLTGLIGICHETGHARYEQQLPKEWSTQPVGQIHSMAMHESQSLFIEMQVCRTQEFMQFLSPYVKNIFGDKPEFDANNLYHHSTTVQPSLIRVDADEVTYPLHVILRYELEKQLFNKQATVNDLPELWHQAMQKYFGLSTQGNNKNGVMQDVHWPSGAYGYFPAYTLGRLMAAQLFQQLMQDHPDALTQLSQGKSETIFAWLKHHVHQHASSLTSQEILTKATGLPLTAQCFLDHIEQRYLTG